MFWWANALKILPRTRTLLAACAAMMMRQPWLCCVAPARKRQAVGTHLFREGDIAHHIYEITSGVFRLTRVLGPDDVKRVEEGPDGLTIRLTDYTAPRLMVRIADADDRATWKARLMSRGEAQ